MNAKHQRQVKQVVINSPCSENWNTMTSDSKGAYCGKCAKSVYDFTGKSSTHIVNTLISSSGTEVCGRISNHQLEALNRDLENWTFRSTKSFQSGFTFALLIVFGLTLFSCDQEEDRKQIEQVRETVLATMKEQPDQQVQMLGFIEPVVVDEVDFPEMEIMGAMEMPYVTEPIQEVEFPLQVIEQELHTMGAMVMIDREEIVQQPLVVEYDENGVAYPMEFEAKAFPNPAQEQTTIELALPQTTLFEIALYDMSGKFIQPIHSGELTRGQFRQQLDLSALQPGIYLVIINSTNFKETVRISKL